jgi:hypothetical protein
MSIRGMWHEAQLFFDTLHSFAVALPPSEWQAVHLSS